MDQRIKYALASTEKNYNNPMRLRQIAREVNLSQSRFEHLFKQEVGQTYKAYLKNIRLQKALQLLTHGQLRVSEIAYQSGYSDHSNFSRDFKKLFEKTPSTYRKESG